MIFWVLVLFVSLGVVIGVAAPMLRLNRNEAPEKVSIARLGALGALTAAPLVAAFVYFAIGAPQSLSPTFQKGVTEPPAGAAEAIAALAPEERTAAIESMVEGLAARLEETPDDIEGWRMLGRSYAILGRPAESAAAYRQVLTFNDEKAAAADWRNYVTALLGVQGSEDSAFNEELIRALNSLLEASENEPLALFYLGLNAHENNDSVTALAFWRKLQENLPPDAPIMAQLQALIDEAAGKVP